MKLVHEVKMKVDSRDEARHTEKAICDLKGRGERWTSKCDNIRGASIIVSLKRDEILQVRRLTGGENFVSKRNQFIVYALLNFQPVKRFKNRGDV